MKTELIAIVVCFLSLSCCSSRKNSVSILHVKNRVTDWRKVEQNGDAFIKNVNKILYRNNKIFLHNSMGFQLLVFDDTKYCSSIGKPGQGPDEISRIVSFDVDTAHIYILDFPDKMLVFDSDGVFLRSFRMKAIHWKGFESYSAHDFFVADGTIYICYGIREPTIRKFSLKNGVYQGDLVANPESVSSGNGADFKIYPDYGRNIVVVSDNSRGKICFYSLKTGKRLQIIDRIDRAVEEEARKFELAFRKEPPAGIQVICLATSSYCDERGELCVVPRIGNVDHLLRYVTYAFGKKEAVEVQIDTTAMKTDFGKVIQMTMIDERNLMAIDDMGELYKIKIGGSR
jgi:hypothetical protein